MQGFDEYMNMVLDEAEEVHMRKAHRKPLGAHLACSACLQPSARHQTSTLACMCSDAVPLLASSPQRRCCARLQTAGLCTTAPCFARLQTAVQVVDAEECAVQGASC